MITRFLFLFLALPMLSFGQGLTLHDVSFVGTVAGTNAAAGGGGSAPTIVSEGTSTWTDSAINETIASVSWESGDLVIVVAGTADDPQTLNTPTVTGLTFSLIDSVSGNSDCRLYLWTATAGSASSGSISVTGNNSTDYHGAYAFVVRGTSGIGTPGKTSPGTSATTVSLTRTAANSIVVCAMADWTAQNDTSVTATPTGTVVVGNTGNTSYVSGNWNAFVCKYGDQGASGTTGYGITSYTGTPDIVMMAVEIKAQ